MKSAFKIFSKGLYATLLMFLGLSFLVVISRGFWEIIKFVYSW